MIFTSPPSPNAMIDDALRVGLPSKRGLTTKSTPSMISRATSCNGPSQGAEHPAAEFVVGDAHAERPFVGDEVFGKPCGARQDGRQGRGGQLHHLEGDSRGLVDVADDHVGRGAQHEH